MQSLGFLSRIQPLILPKIDNYEALLEVLNCIIQQAPTYGSVGPPVYMVLAQAMNTNEGFNTFLNPELNKQFKLLFQPWARFLDSADSRYVLNTGEGGWFSVPALKALQEEFPGKSFFETYISEDDPDNFYGFKSFDDFFNRQFQPGVRELRFPDKPNVINAACESSLYNIARNVGERDEFWLKGEPYSLDHMLAGHYVKEFTGGTVFQGFLQVSGYHRWHSPVTGTVEKIVPIEGTYFAQSPAILNGDYYGSSPPAPGPDLATNPFLRSLSFVTSLTTRLLVFIRSDYENIGLMCFIAIGLTEISTCVLNEKIKEGAKVTRGDELGMFRFGGSSHALIFGPNTDLTFFDEYSRPGQHVRVRDALASVPKLAPAYVRLYSSDLHG
jgi:phosphatidylserine decarboxylase